MCGPSPDVVSFAKILSRDEMRKSRSDLCLRSMIGAGMRRRIADGGRRLAGVDRFRLKRRNPSTKDGTILI